MLNVKAFSKKHGYVTCETWRVKQRFCVKKYHTFFFTLYVRTTRFYRERCSPYMTFIMGGLNLVQTLFQFFIHNNLLCKWNSYPHGNCYPLCCMSVHQNPRKLEKSGKFSEKTRRTEFPGISGNFFRGFLGIPEIPGNFSENLGVFLRTRAAEQDTRR